MISGVCHRFIHCNNRISLHHAMQSVNSIHEKEGGARRTVRIEYSPLNPMKKIRDVSSPCEEGKKRVTDWVEGNLDGLPTSSSD
jgi:hypothetical protein